MSLQVQSRRPELPQSWTTAQASSARTIIQQQIDLEITLKLREVKAFEARIRWAQLLRDQLLNPAQKPGTCSGQFEAAFTQHFQAINAASRPFAPLAPLISKSSSNSPGTIYKALPRLPRRSFSRTPSLRSSTPSSSITSTPVSTPGSRRPSGRFRPSTAGSLYLILPTDDNTLNNCAVLILSCRQCDRTTFSNLQGLFNHCRLKHHVNYLSHDDLIRASGRLSTDEMEIEDVKLNGIQIPSNGLAGLKSMLQQGTGMRRDLSASVEQSNSPEDSRLRQAISDTTKVSNFWSTPHQLVTPILEKVLQMFPLTLDDWHHVQPPGVTYPVQPSRAHLLTLSMGRRKAIEWRHAYLLRQVFHAPENAGLSAAISPEVVAAIDTHFVFRWLESRAYFPRLASASSSGSPAHTTEVDSEFTEDRCTLLPDPDELSIIGSDSRNSPRSHSQWSPCIEATLEHHPMYCDDTEFLCASHRFHSLTSSKGGSELVHDGIPEIRPDHDMNEIYNVPGLIHNCGTLNNVPFGGNYDRRVNSDNMEFLDAWFEA